MPEESKLSLDKFHDLGGKYFETLVALALDELGYQDGETYLGPWAEKCVPGTWVEADFIISSKSEKSKNPLNNGRIVLAIGHATSENSAGMKFHRDVEQLMEVKALCNGDDYRVMDILFCCPRETMGGWSKELVDINEAIFDNSLIVWRHEWGVRLLQQIQLHGEKLTQGDTAAKKRKLKGLLLTHEAFRRQFEAFTKHFSEMLDDKNSHSRIADIFKGERKALSRRLSIPLLITQTEPTDFKRGLLQVLALNPWEVKLLHRNHHENKHGKVYPLEKLALQCGMSDKDFDDLWIRLQLLCVKLGKCSSEFLGDDILLPDAKEWRMWQSSPELSFVLERFPVDALREFSQNLESSSVNLFAYAIELRNLGRLDKVVTFLSKILSANDFTAFFDGLCEHFDKRHFLGVERKRLVLLEVAMAAICTSVSEFSYDKMAKLSGEPSLVANSNQFRRYPKLQGNPRSGMFQAGARAIWEQLKRLPERFIERNRDDILKTYVSRALYGMVRQPRAGEGALDVLLKETIISFAKRIGASVQITRDFGGEVSAFGGFIGSSAAGVNVEIPYVLTLKSGRRVMVHRVTATEGNAGHKWKEFASKMRSIRYESVGRDRFKIVDTCEATVLILDGKWTRETAIDPFSFIRVLQVAGWDYVVYPDQLTAAFAQIEKAMSASPSRKVVPLHSSEEFDELPIAAESGIPTKLPRRGQNNDR